MSDAPLRLVIFDVDGTLVDSQMDILAAMGQAFDRAELPVPARDEVLGIVGLSLPEAFERLAMGAPSALRLNMVEWYKDAYVALRAKVGAAQSSPFYPGAREMLDRLHAVPEILLGVATGKSRRGLDKLLEGHDMRHFFVTQQVADHHPSKPHPAMILAALSETGVAPDEAVMVGDTVFDMEMAQAAGVRSVAVSWGYHPAERLSQANALIEDFNDLPGILNGFWGTEI